MGTLLATARRLRISSRARLRRQYATSLGRHRDELVTPALVLDVAAAERNITRMAEAMRPRTAKLSPHIKVHKSPDLATRQAAAGATSLCTATVWEAAVVAASGIDDIFVVNTVAGPDKLSAVAELAADRRIRVAVDDPVAARGLDKAARDAGSIVGVMVEVDTGMDRCGVDTVDEAIAVASVVNDLPALRLEGITGYEGHCSRTPEHDLRLERQRAAMAMLTTVASAIRDAGLPCQVVSAGGTATWDWTSTYPGITEIQAGSYVLMDNFHDHMAPGFEHALTVQARVISVRPDRVVVDAGNKSMGAGELASIDGYPYKVLRFSEEHGTFITPERSPLIFGDSVHLIPGYSPGTVNWYDVYHVVDEAGVVVDLWPVLPRGPGHLGLAPH